MVLRDSDSIDFYLFSIKSIKYLSFICLEGLFCYRYNQKITLTEIPGGKDKKVYLAKLKNDKKFIVLCDKKNTLMQNSLFDREYSKLETGVCHRDLNLGNFIFINNEAYLIDFDRYRLWPFVYEIKRFFIYEENRKFIKDFMTGYLRVRKINEFEQKYLIEKFKELKEIF